MASIVKIPFNDTLSGTAGNDFIYSETGHDSLHSEDVGSLPPQPSCCNGAPKRANEPEEPGPLGLWRTTAPTVVRSAATDTAPELANLPIRAVLWPIEIGETWSRVNGRAGAVTYTGYVRTGSITRADKELGEEWSP